MPFWRRNRDEPPVPEVDEPVDPALVDPDWEPDPADFGDLDDGTPGEPIPTTDPLLPFDAEPEGWSDGEAIAATRDVIARAVERQMVSDVPVGAFLSGGGHTARDGWPGTRPGANAPPAWQSIPERRPAPL